MINNPTAVSPHRWDTPARAKHAVPVSVPDTSLCKRGSLDSKEYYMLEKQEY